MQKNGFTLIEILVVATIIVLLSTIGMMGYQAAGKSSRDAKRKADIEQLRSALEIYKAESATGVYPGVASCNPSGLVPTYISALPLDPKPATNKYCYVPGAAPVRTYTLCASLEAGAGSAIGACGSNCTGVCNYALTNP